MPNSSTLLITADTDAGTLKEDIDVSIEGDTIDIDFNARYLIDALKNIDDENIRLEFNGSQGPCIIVPCDGNDFVYLVLPIRR